MNWSIGKTRPVEAARRGAGGTSASALDEARPGRAELIISRPRGCSFGAMRRVRLELDGNRVAALRYGATVRIPVDEGVHLLRAYWRPLWPASLPFELGAGQTVRLQTCVDVVEGLQISRDDGRSDRWRRDTSRTVSR